MASTNQPGTNEGLWILLEREPELTNGLTASLLPGACREDCCASRRKPPT